ncbi:MAG: hypothetical protein EPN40_14490 [Rhodanobacteraceae bacterium]|nr:MAG: hypothetical protein EPN40_14490 [Rhodanobacteraceae bacterium]
MIVFADLRESDATAMKFKLVSVMLAGVLMVAAVVAGAAPPRSAPPPPPPAPSHPATLEQAVKQVQHQTSGHILAADTVSRGRTQVYRIKVLKPDGKVQVMQLNSNPRQQGHSNRSDSDQGGH